MIKMTNIHKSFGTLEVLCGIDLTVRKDEIIAIVGPSGSGKSTLLRCINLLERINRGAVEIEGTVIQAVDQPGFVAAPKAQLRKTLNKTGMVFQSFNLFPHRTAMGNVIEALITVKKMKKAEAKEIGAQQLARVGLADKADAYPSHLSGGQKQRVAIARALAMGPDVMLFDEPTSALDPELIGEVLEVIRKLAKEHMTMLVVTHEMSFAREVADRVIFLDRGQILADCSPDEFFDSKQHQRICSFLDKML
ncbi:MAG: amino acid ABC transporter ATP-binding protein [Clostridia bacterium]|nr:amino acid ABC transporter ATP-binding protein [Clostridia bacterium]